jgi:cell division GTPase FtsZ
MEEVKRACMFSDVSCLYGSDIKAEIDEIVWQMSHESQIVPIKATEIEYLYEESVIVKRRFSSCAEDGEERMESVVREIKKYEPADKKSFEHVLILIQTSKAYPLIMSELQSLNDITEGFSPKAEIRWGLGINEDLDDRMFIMLVCSRHHINT